MPKDAVQSNHDVPELILGSQSLQRHDLLATLGIPFTVMAADINEKAVRIQNLKKRALVIAQAKAEKIALEKPEACIITADTFLSLGGVVLEKPKTPEKAAKMLKKQSGQTMQLYTGCCVWYKDEWIVAETVVVSLSVRPLSAQEIKRYVSENPVTSWAAGFSPAFPPGMALLSQVNGSFTSLLGLPVEIIVPALQKIGFKF